MMGWGQNRAAVDYIVLAEGHKGVDMCDRCTKLETLLRRERVVHANILTGLERLSMNARVENQQFRNEMLEFLAEDFVEDDVA